MAEGNETSGEEPGRGGQPGRGPDGPGRREGDLLSERRARRAAESGEVALTRRAEAAEATVQTLERHVASLQQRLREAEEEQLRVAELLEVEKTAALEREHELRRVKQREYAEQQLRVEAEDRLAGVDRETRTQSERLGQRLDAGADDTRQLAARVEQLQRQLADAEHAAEAERAQVHRAEAELRLRLGELESRTAQMQVGLEHERAARERTERELEAMRAGHGQMERLVGEMRAIVARLTASAFAAAPATPSAPTGGPFAQAAGAAASPAAPAADPAADPASEARGAEMADALAAAVERLRARADAATPGQPAGAEARQATPPHKHSMSLIKRLRIRRKQRRSR